MDSLKATPTTEEIKQYLISYWREALKECTITKSQIKQVEECIRNVQLKLKEMEKQNCIFPNWKVSIDEKTGEIIVECVPIINTLTVTIPMKK